MKTTKHTIIYILLLVVTLSGCKKYLDDASVNPNDPEKATPSSLLANIEVATFSNTSGNLARRSGILIQQLAGTDGQMIELANYQILEGDVTNEWNGIYNNVIINCNIMNADFGERNPYFNGIAKVLKAYNLGLATTNWGDVPFTEAGKGLSDNIMSPKYDTQQNIYASLQTLLSEAITDLEKPEDANDYFPSGDFIHGGDPAKWIKTAWLLKARFANHLSQRNAGESASLALQYLENAGLTGTEDDANAIFGENGNELNQWYAFESSRGGYIRMGAYFIDTLKASNDPRLPFYATTDDDGLYTGSNVDPGLANISASAVGTYFGSANSPAPMATYVEALFIKAEANLRVGNTAEAATAYNEAVKASIAQVTGASDAAYEAIYANETSESVNLSKIMYQKYVALFTQNEVWTDWRRTGFPQLEANPSGFVSGIPTILPTPQEERLYNPNAVNVTNVLNKMWIDAD
jgi:hypothetical protein